MNNERKLNDLLFNVGDMALKRRARKIIEGLELKKGDKVLDAGCGDGFYLHLLNELGEYKIVGLDFDKAALKSAKNNLKGTKVEILHGTLMKLPFKANTFNKVFATEVIEHIPNDLQGLQELYRVLKPKGTLIITVPNHNFPFFWDPVNWTLGHLFGTHIKSGFWAGIWNQHDRLYYPQEIKNLIKKAGFKIKESENVTHYCLPFNHNILHFGARMLHSGKLDPKAKADINKFTTTKKRSSNLVEMAFKVFAAVDKRNDSSKNQSSVSVFVKAVK